MRLQPNDEVVWIDPDEGVSSGYYKVVTCRKGELEDDDVIVLSDDSGTVLEAFFHELDCQEGTEGQDRESYSDTQDRDNYTEED